MVSITALLVSSVPFVAAADIKTAFKEHCIAYGVEATDHFFENFVLNDEFINSHNENGQHSFRLGHNQFSHLNFEEFREKFLTNKIPEKEEGRKILRAGEGKKAADSVDWSKTDAVTGVKDQGECGSCWSFSATGAMEGAYYIKYGTPISFSEQQLIECFRGDCGGSFMDSAFAYIADNGLTTEEEYPYASLDGQSGDCQGFTPVDGTKSLTFTDVDNDEDALAVAVTQQPVSVAVDAHVNWQFYESGVMTNVTDTWLNHGVLAVGYGVDDDGTHFWKIKNEWNSSWGEEGYIRILKDVNQTGGPCGITKGPASFPNLA